MIVVKRVSRCDNKAMVLVFVIILLATLENIWPIVAGYMATPKNYVFLVSDA